MNYTKLGIFLTFNIALIGAIVLLNNQIVIPDYLILILTTFVTALVGLQTNIEKD